jgi:hypothetical protein
MRKRWRMLDVGGKDGTACRIPRPLTPYSSTLLLYRCIYRRKRPISIAVFGRGVGGCKGGINHLAIWVPDILSRPLSRPSHLSGHGSSCSRFTHELNCGQPTDSAQCYSSTVDSSNAQTRACSYERYPARKVWHARQKAAADGTSQPGRTCE